MSNYEKLGVDADNTIVTEAQVAELLDGSEIFRVEYPGRNVLRLHGWSEGLTSGQRFVLEVEAVTEVGGAHNLVFRLLA